MADTTELMKQTLQHIIHDRHEEAIETMHQYHVLKSREVTGLGQPLVPELEDHSTVSDDDLTDDDTTEE